MDGHVGVVKLGFDWTRHAPRFTRNRHDHVRCPGTIHQFMKAIDRAEHGDRVGLSVEGQMPMTRPQSRRPAVTRVDETDDRRAIPGTVAKAADQSACIAALAYQDDARRGRRMNGRRRIRPNAVVMAVHESPRASRCQARRRRDSRPHGALGPDRFHPGSYHPWHTSLDSDFLQAVRSTEPTLNLSYSENKR
jgi:hypothetical protein